LSDVALQSVGLAAFAIPFGLFCLGWKWIRSAPPIDGPGIKTFGFLLLALAISVAFGLWPEWRPLGSAVPASGLLGMLLASFLVGHFNELGAWLVTMGALTLSIYLVSTFQIRMLAEWFAGPIGFFGRVAARLSAWREHRAERVASRREARVRAAVEAAEAAAALAAQVTGAPEIKPRRARAAAVGAGASVREDSLAHAGIFPVPAPLSQLFEPPIVPGPGVYEARAGNFDPFDDDDRDIPIHMVAETGA